MTSQNTSQKNYHLLEDAAQKSGVHLEIILRFVTYQWIIPAESSGPYLDEEDLARIKLIHELQHKFGVNDESIPIILHLIDQLNRTHIEVKKRMT